MDANNKHTCNKNLKYASTHTYTLRVARRSVSAKHLIFLLPGPPLSVGSLPNTCQRLWSPPERGNALTPFRQLSNHSIEAAADSPRRPPHGALRSLTGSSSPCLPKKSSPHQARDQAPTGESGTNLLPCSPHSPATHLQGDQIYRQRQPPASTLLSMHPHFFFQHTYCSCSPWPWPAKCV